MVDILCSKMPQFVLMEHLDNCSWNMENCVKYIRISLLLREIE